MQKPSTITEAVAMAQALMQNDLRNCKQGYTFENAVIAVAEFSGLDKQQIEEALEDRMAAQDREMDELGMKLDADAVS